MTKLLALEPGDKLIAKQDTAYLRKGQTYKYLGLYGKSRPPV